MKSVTRSLLTGAALALLAPGALAANGVWTGSGGDGLWSNSDNWTGGVADAGTAGFNSTDLPAGTTTVHLDSARTLTGITFGDTDTATAGSWLLDNNGNAANTFSLSAGTITVNPLGAGATATIGANIVSTNQLTKTGAGTLVLSGSNNFSGSPYVALVIREGTLQISGGNSVITQDLNLGEGGTPANTFAMTGGTLAQTGGGMWIGNWAGTAPSTVNFSGNSTYTGLIVNFGVRRSAEMNIGDSSGVTVDTVRTNWQNDSAGTATLNLNGGTLATRTIAFVGSSAGNAFHVNLNGGTLKARENQAAFMTGLTTATVKTGGAKIDSDGFAITIGQALLHDSGLGATLDGGLTKLGAGNLTLTGTNTYTGVTTVSSGTLTVGSTGSVIVSGLVAGAANGIVINASATLAMESGGKLLIAATDAKILNNGALSGAGVLDLGSQFDNFNGRASGTYDLISGNAATAAFSVTGYDNGIWSSVTFDNATGKLNFTAVPEPSTYGLLGAGALAAFALARRRKKSV